MSILELDQSTLRRLQEAFASPGLTLELVKGIMLV
jgi:hypothetical protein